MTKTSDEKLIERLQGWQGDMPDALKADLAAAAKRIAELATEIERLTPRYPQPCFNHEYIRAGCPDCGKLEPIPDGR